MLNSSVEIKSPPCGLTEPCEWPLQWTLLAAFGSVTTFCIIQVALYFINDPGSKIQTVYISFKISPKYFKREGTSTTKYNYYS